MPARFDIMPDGKSLLNNTIISDVLEKYISKILIKSTVVRYIKNISSPAAYEIEPRLLEELILRWVNCWDLYF